jgi:FixJ family two-component response regulator
LSKSAGLVYLVDDDSSIRRSVGRLLKIEGLRSELFSSAEEFLAVKKLERPACLISDIRMPGLNGLELQELCSQIGRRIPIVFITGHGEVPLSVQAMKQGAVDFLPKPFDPDALLKAVHEALDKDRLLQTQENSSDRVQHRFKKLSHREREVLHGVIAGHLNKQIALKLEITVKTVKVHRANVMMKMKARSVPHLVRLAGAVGITVSSN